MRATRHSPQALACLVLLLAGLLGACIGTGPTVAPSDGSSPGSASASPSDVVAATEAAPAATPAAEPTPLPTEPAGPPTEPAASPPPGIEEPSGTPGPAAACSGSDDNRDFYVEAADTFDWDVYCPTLAAGWFVTTGEYRLAGGGRLEIAYRGPGGASLTLREGAFCSAADGCVPAGTDAGEASFGDRSGALVALDDGGWAISVDRGAAIAWLALARGLDAAAFEEVAADLVVVRD